MAKRLNTPAFNKALANANREQTMKVIRNRAIKRDTDYLIAEGMDPKIAKVYAKSMREAGITVRLKGGRK